MEGLDLAITLSICLLPKVYAVDLMHVLQCPTKPIFLEIIKKMNDEFVSKTRRGFYPTMKY